MINIIYHSKNRQGCWEYRLKKIKNEIAKYYTKEGESPVI